MNILERIRTGALVLCVLFVGCTKELPVEPTLETTTPVLQDDLEPLTLAKSKGSPTVELFVEGLDSPEGMDFLGKTMYIVESNPSRLLEIRADGTISTLVEFQAGRLVDVLADPIRGLFVSDLDEGKIYLVKPSGEVSTFAAGLIGPTRMALDASGDLYVTEIAGIEERVTKIADDGTLTTIIAYDEAQDVNPNGLYFDKDGNLFVAEAIRGEIRKFTFDDTTSLPIIAETISPLVSSGGSFIGLVIDKSGMLWTCGRNELFRITPSGAVTTIVSGLVGPFNGVGIGSNGQVFVSDYGSGEIFSVSKTK